MHIDLFAKWLEEHEKLAGWAQFLAAVVTLAASYFTVFIPIWSNKSEKSIAEEQRKKSFYKIAKYIEYKHVMFTCMIYNSGFLGANSHIFWITDSISILERISIDNIPLDKIGDYVDILHFLRSTLTEHNDIIEIFDKMNNDDERYKFDSTDLREDFIIAYIERNILISNNVKSLSSTR